jgi:serine phosphatase RsbU (regulator of sigma subunit)/PAS domain-containing protein
MLQASLVTRALRLRAGRVLSLEGIIGSFCKQSPPCRGTRRGVPDARVLKSGAVTDEGGDMTDAGHEPGGQEDLRAMLDWALTQSPLNIGLYDSQVRLLRINETMCHAIGLETEAAGLGLRLTELLPELGFATFEATARRVMLAGEPAVWEGFGKGPNETRDRAWRLYISPVKDPDDKVCGILSVGLDITGHRLARKRLAMVNDASNRIGSTLDVTRTAEELIEVTVPQLADMAIVDIQDSVLRGDEPPSGPVSATVPLRRMACGSVLDDAPEVVVQPGQVASYPASTPAGDALAAGRSVILSPSDRDFDRWAAWDPVRAERAARHGLHSVMVVPLRARGATLGVAIFVRHRRPEGFEQDDLTLAEEIVTRAAVCIDNARRYAREHATALALQHSLLQRRQPAQAAVEVATRYVPGQSGVAVGGDWSDVIALSGGRVGLVIGDVAGHGIRAAATMGRLRTAVRTLADIDLEPEELLTRLDDVITRLADEDELSADASDLSATCVFAVYDPITRRCTLARAGHPVPAIVVPGGTPVYLDLPAGPPLGVGGVPFEETEIELPEGSLLVFYTDGLVESRGRDIDAGLDATCKVLSELHSRPGGPPSLETVCDSLVETLIPEPAGDDAALLVVRTCALAPDRVVSWDLPAEPAIVADARARAARQAVAWGLGELTFTTELLVSELVTNAIRHAQPPIQLRMILDTVLSCEVSDASVTAPHHRRADRYDEGGRGLMLVARLAARWGTRYTANGKTIWAQQSLPHRATTARE